MMYLNTARIPWHAWRTAVAADDTLLTAFDYLSLWPTTGVITLSAPPFQDANGVLVAFHGTAAADKDFLYNIYGRTRQNGPKQLLLSGVATLGTQNCTISPIDNVTAITNGEWADTITVTGGIFKDDVDILDSGNNRICMLRFDTQHIEDMFCEIDLDGGSDAATLAYSIITVY